MMHTAVSVSFSSGNNNSSILTDIYSAHAWSNSDRSRLFSLSRDLDPTDHYGQMASFILEKRENIDNAIGDLSFLRDKKEENCFAERENRDSIDSEEEKAGP